MMKLKLLLLTAIVNVSLSAQLKYPGTLKTGQEDDYFGTKVADPYRWLEDDNSTATKDWVSKQNEVTSAYLSTIPFRDKVKTRLQELWNYPKYGSPFKKGSYYYFYKNDGLQNQSVLYRLTGLDATPEVFIDPNTLAADGTTSMSGLTFSKNNKYCAYLLAQSGSDWQTVYVMDAISKELMPDKLNWIKFSGISWNGDEGFYYSRYDAPDEKSKLSKANEFHKAYYHKMGTPQSEDVLIYQDKEHPQRTLGTFLTEDGRFLILHISEGTSGQELWVKDMKKKNDFTLLFKGFDHEAGVVDNDGERLLIRTNMDAPNYKIVSVDPAKPEKENWETIIPTRSKLLQSAGTAGGKLLLTYLEDASSKVYQCSYKGKLDWEIQLPGIGTASGFDADPESTELFYSYSSFNYPPSIFRYNIKTGTSNLFRKTEVKMNTANLVTVQTFFTSKDGTRVPMFISYKNGIKLDGNNPVLLYGYGGFNLPQTPGFSISNAFFMEQGGVYVVVNLRGGNEYGEDWHKNGMLQNKQHVFDDMISAAEFLIEKKYTNKERIALRGGSNGGLLVGACITQRPDLFKVAIPQVGVMDMLRYHLFTIGWAWAVEYGRSDKDKASFQNLYSYSPLHNLKPGTTYPATLVTTADHDDRVVPAHSFKFAARLQECNAGANPTIIRIESKAGHGGGKPTSKQIEETADIWSFVMYNLGMKFN